MNEAILIRHPVELLIGKISLAGEVARQRDALAAQVLGQLWPGAKLDPSLYYAAS